MQQKIRCSGSAAMYNERAVEQNTNRTRCRIAISRANRSREEGTTRRAARNKNGQVYSIMDVNEEWAKRRSAGNMLLSNKQTRIKGEGS
jgi:hypothetical protein